MPNPIAFSQSDPASMAPTTPVVTDTNTQVAGAAATASSGSKSDTTNFRNLNEFQKKYPEVYKKMMEGIATTIVNDMKHHQERLVKIWRKNRQG